MDCPTPNLGSGPLQAATDRQVLLADLHARLIRADPEARDRLAEELLPFLKQALWRRFRFAAEDLIVDAIVDAFLEYAADPHRLDTAVVHLDSLLLRAARLNLMNFLEAERRRRARERKYVESAAQTASREQSLPNDGAASTLRRLLRVVEDDRERQALLSWLDGDGATASLAARLGLAQTALEEQRKGVKRFKDRIIKRLRRDFTKS